MSVAAEVIRIDEAERGDLHFAFCPSVGDEIEVEDGDSLTLSSDRYLVTRRILTPGRRTRLVVKSATVIPRFGGGTVKRIEP